MRNVLTTLAAATGWPVAAFLCGGDSDPVRELLLYRDPSRRFGVPSIPDSVAAAQTLAVATGWLLAAGRAPRGGILVGLGLRGGYGLGAPQHGPEKPAERIVQGGAGWTCRPARLVSARSGAPWYDEQGAIVHGSAPLQPAITASAAAFQQQRFVVTSMRTACTPFPCEAATKLGRSAGRLREDVTAHVLASNWISQPQRRPRPARYPASGPGAEGSPPPGGRES